MTETVPSLSRRQIDWLVLVCVDATVPAMLAWKKHAGSVTVSVAILTAFCVLAAMNATFLLAFVRRNRIQSTPTSRAFIAGAIGLALLSALGSIVAVVSIPENSGYLQLALSSIPLNDIQPEQKRLVVELIRRRTANSRENNLLIADVKKNPISPPIYSPESFADLAVIRKTTGRLQQIVAAELDYSGKQQQAMADFRTKMSKADPDYLRAWDESEKEQEAAEAKAISREKEWVASVMDLYDFAAKHIDSIKLRQGTVQFSKSALGEEFDQKQSLSKALQEKFLDLENELAQRQQQAQKKRGF